ncbi:pyridoxamine 5'-phosphate oxidase family protein [Micromonospora sp. NPDC047620]|uniref:pyridoxamine 5'-phosphate oxidase family protein n=1 Tax=Micromonospora sp. NPDC047620 TaxID=3364251 RepID=UPI003718FEF8
MTEDDLVRRAVKLVRENRYLTLATCGGGMPWAAPINYVIGPGSHLHFYSTPTARHSRHIAATRSVAAAIFDSTAVGDDVDGMQFVGECAEVTGPELAAVCEHYFATNFPDPQVREWWYRPPTEFEGDGTWRFYRLEFTEIHLIDVESFEETKVDARVEVPLARFLDALRA